MWVCPVCEQNNNEEMLCPRCGYDKSRDYERYPTLSPIRDSLPLSVRWEPWARQQSANISKKCPFCQSGIPTTHRFCGFCGCDTITKKCPICHGDIPTAHRFCGFCGCDTTTVPREALPAEPPTPQAKEKIKVQPSIPDAADNENVRLLHKTATQGHADAPFQLGKCYHSGKGVEQNYTRAVILLHKAAEQKDAHAQYELGRCYLFGQDVEKNHTEAVKWFRKAAEQGHKSAQSALGDCYLRGWGVTENAAEANEWYRKAAEQEHKLAQTALSGSNPIGAFLLRKGN